MEARLKAILEMESSQMQKELIAASNNLKKFERELATATDTGHITYLQRSITLLNADITRLTVAANTNSRAMTGMATSTAAAGNAMRASTMTGQNFARVIQDLPFGFMGIQNNLTQLIPGIGLAGIAFSALTAAITFSQVGLTYWSRGAKDAKASVSDLAEYTKEFTKNAAEEGVKARLLYEASNNVAISMNKRIAAAKELKGMYPDILANYSAEDIALGKASKGYQDLTKSILANAKAQAAMNKITELEAEIQNRQFNIEKIKAITGKQTKDAATDPINKRLVKYQKEQVIKERKLAIEKRKSLAISKEQAEIDKLKASQKFFETLGGGATNVQGAVIPKPDKPKTYAPPTVKDGALAGMISTSNDFQNKKGKWWRDAQTVRGNDLTTFGNTKTIKGTGPNDTDTTVLDVRIEQNATLNKILAEQAEIQMQVNQQLAGMTEIAEFGGQVFGQMINAMMNGGDIGEVLVNAFKQIAIQIAAAVAQALIFAALLEAFPALKGVFGTVGAVSGAMGQSGGAANIGGRVMGMDIQLSQQRTSTGMGFRRGPR